MKYQLSYCDIERLSDNILEVTPKKGIVVNQNTLNEYWALLDEIQNKPFGLLINRKNTYFRSFVGSMEIGKHPLQKRTAILYSNNKELERQLRKTQEIKKMSGHHWIHKVFTDRDEAIKWLSDI